MIFKKSQRMSLENILVPNILNVFVNDLVANDISTNTLEVAGIINPNEYFSAVTSGTQSIVTTVESQINFNTKLTDSAPAYNSTTSIYTVPTSGIYHFESKIGLDVLPSSGPNLLSLIARMIKNTSVQIREAKYQNIVVAPSGTPYHFDLDLFIADFFTLGDTVLITVQTSISGGTVAINTTQAETCFIGYKM